MNSIPVARQLEVGHRLRDAVVLDALPPGGLDAGGFRRRLGVVRALLKVGKPVPLPARQLLHVGDGAAAATGTLFRGLGRVAGGCGGGSGLCLLLKGEAPALDQAGRGLGDAVLGGYSMPGSPDCGESRLASDRVAVRFEIVGIHPMAIYRR